MVVIYLALVFMVSIAYGQQAPVAAASATPVAAATPAPTPQLTVKDEILVPPTWVQDALIMVKSLPVVGPIVTQVLQWTGVVVTILTAFVAFLLTSIRALSTVMTLAGLAIASQKIESFRDSKIMYWLKYFSMFNAEKKKDL